MKKLISLFSIATVVYSCGQDNSEVSTAVPIISKNISDSVVISTPKSLMDEFLDILEKDSFDIKVIKEVEPLKFKKLAYIPSGFKVLDTLKIPTVKMQAFKVKRKYTLKGKESLFPRFDIFQIAYATEIEAKENKEKILSFINHDDLINEKKYDFVIQDGKTLIYVCCNAMIFSEITFSYQEKLEKVASE